MTVLNITYEGQSADYELQLDRGATDADIKRIAIELVRSGGAKGLYIANLRQDAFATFVVDRMRSPDGEERIYLRPKVPFGA
jgi:hypothetical protein